MSVINENPVNHLEQPLFFGETLGVARFESMKHKVFDKITEKQLSFFWRPEEVDLSKDRIDYHNMPKEYQNIFDANLEYQTFLDTVQGRAPVMAFLDIVSDVGLENWITTWTFSETIHSRSYTHIQRNLHSNPSERFDSIVENKAIMKRAHAITKYYDDLIDGIKLYKVFGEKEFLHPDTNEPTQITLRELKKRLYLCFHAVNALEAIRFYVSFTFTFNFAENELLEGNAKIMKLIARDETLHQAGTQNVIRIWQMNKDDPEMVEIARECEDEATQIFISCVEQEIEWGEYLFSIGKVPVLTLDSTVKYIKHLANQRMRAVGLSSPYEEYSENPYKWMSKWLTSDIVQVAPQEVEIGSYLIGQINPDITPVDFDDWKKITGSV